MEEETKNKEEKKQNKIENKKEIELMKTERKAKYNELKRTMKEVWTT